MATDNRYDLSYAHANIRLKTRYGTEITREEWEKMGRTIRDGGGTNRRQNHVGDVEAWVLIHGQWACAYYSAGRNCISTFFACPPPKPGTPEGDAYKEKAPKKMDTARQMEKATDRAEVIVARANRQARDMIEAAHIEADRIISDASSQRPTVADVSWMKSKIHDIGVLMRTDRVLDAYNLAGALASMPRSRPTQDLASTEQFIQDRIAETERHQQRMYQAHGDAALDIGVQIRENDHEVSQ